MPTGRLPISNENALLFMFTMTFVSFGLGYIIVIMLRRLFYEKLDSENGRVLYHKNKTWYNFGKYSIQPLLLIGFAVMYTEIENKFYHQCFIFVLCFLYLVFLTIINISLYRYVIFEGYKGKCFGLELPQWQEYMSAYLIDKVQSVFSTETIYTLWGKVWIVVAFATITFRSFFYDKNVTLQHLIILGILALATSIYATIKTRKASLQMGVRCRIKMVIGKDKNQVASADFLPLSSPKLENDVKASGIYKSFYIMLWLLTISLSVFGIAFGAYLSADASGVIIKITEFEAVPYIVLGIFVLKFLSSIFSSESLKGFVALKEDE